MTRHARYIEITPPAEVDPAGVRMWWANLHDLLRRRTLNRLLHGQPHVGVEYRWTGRQMTIGVWVPGTVAAGPVAAAVRAAWPGSATTVTDVTAPDPRRRADGRRWRWPRSCRPGTRWRPSRTPTRCAPSSKPRPDCTTPNTRACRSWPARPPHGR